MSKLSLSYDNAYIHKAYEVFLSVGHRNNMLLFKRAQLVRGNTVYYE